jgi:hypothetical protein
MNNAFNGSFAEMVNLDGVSAACRQSFNQWSNYTSAGLRPARLLATTETTGRAPGDTTCSAPDGSEFQWANDKTHILATMTNDLWNASRVSATDGAIYGSSTSLGERAADRGQRAGTMRTPSARDGTRSWRASRLRRSNASGVVVDAEIQGVSRRAGYEWCRCIAGSGVGGQRNVAAGSPGRQSLAAGQTA